MNFLLERLPLELCVEIQSYVSPRYKLIDWVSENKEKLGIAELCESREAVDIIIEFFEKNPIHWSYWTHILRNPSPQILSFVEKKKKKRDDGIEFYTEELYELCLNPSLLSIVKRKIEIKEEDADADADNSDEVVIWSQLVQNPHPQALELIKWDMEGKYAFSQLRWHCDCEDADYGIGCVCQEFKCWSKLCCNTNPEAIAIIEKNINKLDRLCWENLSSNPGAISLLEKNLDVMDRWCWEELSGNPAAVHILEKNLDKVDWYILSGNPSAISLLEKNRDKIVWEVLCRNKNAIPLIEEWMSGGGEPNWEYLSGNPGAIKILEKNQDKIVWKKLSLNPSIFKLDINKMKQDVLGK